MADDISTFQIGSPTDLVAATVTIDDTTQTVGATVSLLSGGVRVPVTVSSATLGANGAVDITGSTPAGASVGIAFIEGAPTASVMTNVLGVTTTNTEAVLAVCYAQGTCIRVIRGGIETDVAVEMLAVGDLAVTASGEQRPIRWLGHRRVDIEGHPNPTFVQPVRIAAHAFDEGRPQRDLLVSPGHSLCCDVLGEVLIPASALVNGTSVAQVDMDSVTYWHVELDAHDILLAENMPAESYLDMGNRSFFIESRVVARDCLPDAQSSSHDDFCRPFHADGPLVEALRAQLSRRAEALVRTRDAGEPAGPQTVAHTRERFVA